MSAIKIKENFKALLADESGATAVEYALLIAILSVGFLASWRSMSGLVSEDFVILSDTLDEAEVFDLSENSESESNDSQAPNTDSNLNAGAGSN